MATKTRAKRTAKAGEGTAKPKTSELQEPGEMRTQHLLDSRALGCERATNTLRKLAEVIRNGSNADILHFVRRGFTIDSPMIHIFWLLSSTEFHELGFFEDEVGESSMMAFYSAWNGMFDAFADRVPQCTAMLYEWLKKFDDFFSDCRWNNWHEEDTDAREVIEAMRATDKRARELLDQFPGALIEVAKKCADADAGGHSVKSAAELARMEAATGVQGATAAKSDAANVAERPGGVDKKPRWPSGDEAKLLQRVYISHNVRRNKRRNYELARHIISCKTLDDWNGVPVRMFDDSGKAFGYEPNSDTAFERWVQRADEGSKVAQMAELFKAHGRSFDLPFDS